MPETSTPGFQIRAGQTVSVDGEPYRVVTNAQLFKDEYDGLRVKLTFEDGSEPADIGARSPVTVQT